MSRGDRSHVVRFGALALSTLENAVESQGVGAAAGVFEWISVLSFEFHVNMSPEPSIFRVLFSCQFQSNEFFL